jgi:hypothetical protein
MRPHVVALALILAAATAVAGCGVLQPTPAYFRPELPPAEAIPDLLAEDVVADLQAMGFACEFDPGGDIGSGWSCRRGDVDGGDYLTVGMQSAETGPIDHIGAHRANHSAPEPLVFDLDAAASIHETLIAIVVPEELRPTEAGLLDGIQRNYPVELGDGWFIGFDRNSISRSVRIVYSTAGD